MFKLTKPLKFGSVAKSYTCDGRELIGDKMELQYIYIYPSAPKIHYYDLWMYNYGRHAWVGPHRWHQNWLHRLSSHKLVSITPCSEQGEHPLYIWAHYLQEFYEREEDDSVPGGHGEQNSQVPPLWAARSYLVHVGHDGVPWYLTCTWGCTAEGWPGEIILIHSL